MGGKRLWLRDLQGAIQMFGSFTTHRLAASPAQHTHPCCLLPAWQVVWKSTTKVGCGAVMCGSSRIYTCSYDPPGNYVGQYTQNVEVRACKPAGCM